MFNGKVNMHWKAVKTVAMFNDKAPAAINLKLH
jgi:hypothetical protein